MLAADIFRCLGKIVGPSEFLEITVEQNPCVDLADFEWDQHSGVLLDGVGDAFILKGNREALQGRPKLCKGGQSATNVYSYKYTLVRRGIVATFDMSAYHLEAFETDHWLSNRKNIIQLNLTEQAWAETPTTPRGSGPSAAAAAPPSPVITGGVKRRWISGSPGHK